MTAKRRLTVAALGGIGVGVYALLVRGSLTVDLGIGRTVRPLGPFTWQIAAPRELVFDVISAPYLGRMPRALESKLHVLDGEDMVLAEHFTPSSNTAARSEPTSGRSAARGARRSRAAGRRPFAAPSRPSRPRRSDEPRQTRVVG